MIDVAALRETLAYDPATGEFRWRKSVSNVKPGALAGSVNAKGYRIIGFGGKFYRANRLAWVYVHGKEPAGQIDHIDGDRLNDRIANLRDVDGFANQRNRRRGNRNSTSNLLGVSLHRQTGKWRAQISFPKWRHLGLFETEQEAHAAYLAAKQSAAIPSLEL